MTDVPDIEIARCALRTFNCVDIRHCDLEDELADALEEGLQDNQAVSFSGRILTGMYRSGGQWLTGACVARCEKGHKAPDEECGCGIYGALSLSLLTASYPQASRLVTVIAAEGKTVIGDLGLRTEASRVVAYWCSPDARVERHQCAKQFLGAKEFADLAMMVQTCGVRLEPEE